MRQPRIFYGWVIVGASTVALLGVGGAYYGFGLFFKPLQDEFGWSYSLTSVVQTVFNLAYGVSLYFSGRLSDTYGPRPLFAAGAVLIALGFSLSSQIHNADQLLALYVVAGIGTGTIWSSAASTVQRWFAERRGLAVSIVSSGVGMGTLLFSPLLSHLISTYGWRTTYVVFGIAAGTLLASSSWFMVSTPEAKGLRPYGAAAELPAAVARGSMSQIGSGPSIGQAVRTRNFVILCLAYLFTALPLTLVAVHIVPSAIERGLTPAVAAAALSLMGVMSVPGRIMGGIAAERLGWKNSMVLFTLLSGAAMVWLIYVWSIWMLYVFAIFYGLAYGARVPQVPGLAGQYFGTRCLGEMTGLITGIGIGLGGLGALLAGIVVDVTGGYSLAFVAGAVLFVVSAVLTALLGAPTMVIPQYGSSSSMISYVAFARAASMYPLIIRSLLSDSRVSSKETAINSNCR